MSESEEWFEARRADGVVVRVPAGPAPDVEGAAVRLDEFGEFIVDFLAREMSPENATGQAKTYESVARFRADGDRFRRVVMDLTNAYLDLTGKRPPEQQA